MLYLICSDCLVVFVRKANIKQYTHPGVVTLFSTISLYRLYHIRTNIADFQTIGAYVNT